jgi:hypothetical protein
LLTLSSHRAGNESHEEPLLEVFSLTVNHEASRFYLERTNWKVVDASSLFVAARFRRSRPPNPVSSANPPPDAGDQQDADHEFLLSETDIVTEDRALSEQFLRDANWDLVPVQEQFLDTLSTPPSERPALELDAQGPAPLVGPRELVHRMSQVTCNDQGSIAYLQRAGFDDEAVEVTPNSFED